jgi:hypothetical protein
MSTNSAMTHLSMGAINTQTGAYVQPKHANKDNDYECPFCSKRVIIRQGEVRCHHFAHTQSDNPCAYYDSPSESQIHKDAKMLMKDLLERKIPISILRPCTSCPDPDIFPIPEMTETSEIQLEYRFDHNRSTKIADVAYIDCNELVSIFEIYNTHKTHPDNRSEPWFEINATVLIKLAAVHDYDSPLEIPCIRREACEECVMRIEKETKETIEREKQKKIQEVQYQRRDRRPWRGTNDADDTADDLRAMRYSNQDHNDRKSSHQQSILINYDIKYTLGNNVVTIIHPIFKTKIRRSLVNNKTFYNGQWRTDIPISKINIWYHNKFPFEELGVAVC